MGILSDIGKKYSKVAEPIVRSIPGLKWTGQEASNFWTGFRVTKPAAALGVSALAMYSAGQGVKAHADNNKANLMANSQNVGLLPATQYEGTNGGRNNLGATGDIVFGLNNKRRG